jgi:hypothetical protein
MLIIGFGTFGVTETMARFGRNPRTGDAHEIAAGKRPKFTAGVKLKATVNVGTVKYGLQKFIEQRRTQFVSLLLTKAHRLNGTFNGIFKRKAMRTNSCAMLNILARYEGWLK